MSHAELRAQLPVVPIEPVTPIIWHTPYGTTCIVCGELWPCQARCDWQAGHRD